MLTKIFTTLTKRFTFKNYSKAMLFTGIAIASCVDTSPLRADPPNPDEWNQISSPGSGVGGVFFVGKDRPTTVIKFVEESPDRVLFAESILGLVKVPTPQTKTYNASSDEFRSISAKVSELSQNGSDRVKNVYEKTAAQASVVQVQTLIEGAGGSESVQGILSDIVALKGGSKTPIKTTVLMKTPKVNDKLLAVKTLLSALANEEQIKTLGRLSIADAYLGNEDRLQKLTLNLNNLMLNTNAEFVAIDNFADAPDMQNLAWEKAANDLVNGAERIAEEKTKKEKTVTLPRSEWYSKVLSGYQMGSGFRTANLEQAMDYDAESDRMASVLKKLTEDLLKDLSGVNTALIPSKGSGAKVAGGIADIKFSDATWTVTVVTSISESKKSPDGAHLSTTDFKIQWKKVQAALKAGMEEATMLIVAGSGANSEIKALTKDKFLKGAIGGLLQKLGTPASGEIDAEALILRSKYMYLRSTGKAKTDIKPADLVPDIGTEKTFTLVLWCQQVSNGPVITKK